MTSCEKASFAVQESFLLSPWEAGRIQETRELERGQPCPRALDLMPETRGHGCPRSNLESTPGQVGKWPTPGRWPTIDPGLHRGAFFQFANLADDAGLLTKT